MKVIVMRMRKMVLLVFMMLSVLGSFAQENATPEVVQFSGYLLTPDSLMGVPYASVFVEGSTKGTISNPEGYFSFAGEAGDTVVFSSIGYKTATYVIPKGLQSNKYSIVKFMTTDTVFLDTVAIYPWPTREMFQQAFLALEFEETDVDRAYKNLENEYLKERGESMAMDASQNADYYLREEARKYYYAGQAPPQNIFNVFAWAQFIEAWKRGDFKRKKKK